jgi:hypothetical protein
MRLFIIESPNVIDMLMDRTECQSLEKICKLIGHDIVSFTVKSKKELGNYIKYISMIDEEKDTKNKDDGIPLCIHLSAHGDSTGLRIGYEDIDWPELTEILWPVISSDFNYSGPVIVVISSCGSNKQKITNSLEDKWRANENSCIPPKYLFVFDDDTVSWQDAVLAWSIMYHQLPSIDLNKNKEVQDLLSRINNAKLGCIKYFRWDDVNTKYKSFKPK